MPKKVHLRGLLTEVSAQRTQYKPYSYRLSFETDPKVYVEISIDDSHVIEKIPSGVVLSLGGMNAVLEAAADSVDQLHQAYVRDLDPKIQTHIKKVGG